MASWSSAGLSDVTSDKFGIANATVRTVQQCFFALGISVVVTLLAAGGERSELIGVQWAWTWIIIAYVLSAVIIMTTFPSGSADRRQ